MSKLSKLKPIVRLSVVNPDTESNSVFGRGIASLCIGVRDTGSLNAAAKSMCMAYSNGASSRTRKQPLTCSFFTARAPMEAD